MPAITYYSNIPTPSQRLKDSQPLLLANATAVDQLISVDHETFSSSNAGYHKSIHMVEETVSPPINPAVLAGQIGLYVSSADLFIKKGTNTAYNITTTTGNSTVGYYRMPNGLLIKWGYVNGSGPRDALQPTYSYPTGGSIPAFSSIYTVIIGSTQRISGSPGANYFQESRLYSYSTTQIQVFTSGLAGSSGTATDWTYLSIGV